MVVSHIHRIIVFVAINATEQGKISRSGVAIHTLIPFVVVISTINREILLVVIPGGGHPGTGRMAILTSGRELCCAVVRVVRVVVIGLVTPHAGIRGVVVIAVDMAVCTSRILVRSRQRPGTVIPERGDPGIFSVAVLTGNREWHLGVIGIVGA